MKTSLTVKKQKCLSLTKRFFTNTLSYFCFSALLNYALSEIILHSTHSEIVTFYESDEDFFVHFFQELLDQLGLCLAC